MKRNTLILALLALLLVMTASISPALAYFTDNASAEGGKKLTLHYRTTIEESFSDQTKTAVIHNAEDGSPVYVRARAYAGSQYPLTYLPGTAWYDGGDGWFYYAPVLLAGESSAELQVAITFPSAEENASFHVAVVYECVPALYAADGSFAAADWSHELIVEGGSAQ